MKKLIYIVIVFCLLCNVVFAQTKKLDSLLDKFEIHQWRDTTRVNILNELAFLYQNIDLEVTKAYIKEAYDISKEIGFKNGLASSYYNSATYSWLKGDYDISLILCDSALAIFNQTSNNEGIMKCYYRIATIQMFKGNYEEAIDMYFKCLSISEETMNIRWKGMIYNNIGVIYASLNDYKKALECDQIALHVRTELKDTFLIGYSLYNIGFHSLKSGQLDSAIKYSNLSFNLNYKIQNNYILGHSYQLFAEIFDTQELFDSAFKYHYKGIDLIKDYGNERQLSYSYLLLGNHYLLRHQYKKAIEFAEISLNIALKKEDKDYITLNYSTLYKAYLGLEDDKNALRYVSLYQSLNEDLKKKENVKKLAIQEKDYEYKLEQRIRKIEQDALLSKQRSIKNYFVAAFILSCALILFIAYALFQKVKSNRFLKRSNENRDKMLKIISHDFRSPLISISNTLQLMPELIKEEDYEAAIRLSEKDEKSVTRVLSLIDSLISWTLSQNDNIPYNPKNYKLFEISSFIFDLYTPVANYKSINLKNHIPNNIKAYCDKNILNTVLRNLLNNAIKFTPNNGVVEINAKQNNKEVTITVKDNGVGIPKENLEKIFDLNKDKTEGTEGEKGNGLGLFFCKEFVLKNKGEIWVESEVEKGTVIYFTVPAYE
jgi:signal transduction histidine kinase